MGLEQYPGVGRSVTVMQLNQFEIESLHKAEVQSPCLFINAEIRRRYNTNRIGNMTEEEIEAAWEVINTCRPKLKDGVDGEEMDLFSMDYAHAWDWNIFHKADKSVFKVGKLKRKSKNLINEVEDKKDE